MSHRQRFKKPHVCDCEKRMSMDNNVGGGNSDVGMRVTLPSLLVKTGCRERQVDRTDALGRCKASHDCRTSTMVSLRVHKRCTSATSLRTFSANKFRKKVASSLTARSAASSMVLKSTPAATVTADKNTATSVTLLSGSSRSSTIPATVLCMYLLAQSSAALGMIYV